MESSSFALGRILSMLLRVARLRPNVRPGDVETAVKSKTPLEVVKPDAWP